jgi:hypothetical protein
MYMLLPEMQQELRMNIFVQYLPQMLVRLLCTYVCPSLGRFWADYCVLIHVHWVLIKSVGSHGSSLLLFVIKLNGLRLCEQL